MNNYKLILLDEPLLISDENAKKSFGVNKRDCSHIHDFRNTIDADCIDFYKIIAGIPSLPKINFSAEAAKELKEKYGWVDVYTAYQEESFDVSTDGHSSLTTFAAGFRYMQSLIKYKFSESDFDLIVDNSFAAGIFCTSDKMKEALPYFKEKLKKSILQPKQIDVELDMKEEYFVNGGRWIKYPKIFDNHITILKLKP